MAAESLLVTSALRADADRVASHVLAFARTFGADEATLAVAVADDASAGRLAAVLERAAAGAAVELEADIALIPCAEPAALTALLGGARAALDSGCDDLRAAAGAAALPLVASIEEWLARVGSRRVWYHGTQAQRRAVAGALGVSSGDPVAAVRAASAAGCDVFSADDDPRAAALALLAPGIREVELVLTHEEAATATAGDLLASGVDRIAVAEPGLRNRLRQSGVEPAQLDRELRGDSAGPATAAETIDAVLACTYKVTPPGNGGALRLHWLWRSMPPEIGCTAFTLGHDLQRLRTRPVTHARPGRELCVPYGRGFLRSAVLMGKALGATADDLAAALLLDEHSYLGQALSLRAELPVDLVVSAHGTLTQQLLQAFPGVPLVYDSHNVEADLKRSIYGGSTLADEAVAAVEALERESCAEAAAIICCTDEDREALIERFGARPERTHVVANGAPVGQTRFTPWTERHGRPPACVFAGNAHRPNVEAVDAIAAAASALPRVRFDVVGTVCESVDGVPANVRLHGRLPEDEKQRLYAAATLALNPMASGSGSNLKIVDYAAAGLPVVTTRFGARGFSPELVDAFVVYEGDELADAVATSLGEDWDARTRAARAIAERDYDWTALAGRYAAILRDVARRR